MNCPNEFTPEQIKQIGEVQTSYIDVDTELEKKNQSSSPYSEDDFQAPRELTKGEISELKRSQMPPIPVFGADKIFRNEPPKEIQYAPFDIKQFNKNKSAKTLHQRLSIPSMVQSYSLCIEYAKRWFLNLFQDNPFKSIYVDGKNVFDDYRRMSSLELLKREKPALAIIPTFDWSFNDENKNLYQFGSNLYRAAGLYKNSFYRDPDHQSYLGIAMETLFMEFTFRVRVETRAQQLDMFKYLQLAGRVGNTIGEDVDLDFHIPYDIMLALAEDAGFEICAPQTDSPVDYPKVVHPKAFLAHLNSHSDIPFLYKMRAVNGRSEYFIRMHNMYVHTRPTNLNGDDGERQGVMNNNFTVELTTEVRFPVPKFYAYYTSNKKDYTTVYSAWRQPNGIVSAFYTFKGIDVPDKNINGWDKYLETTYEEDIENSGGHLSIDLRPILDERELGETIRHCLATGISPSIFVDAMVINGGEFISGKMNWSNYHFESDRDARSPNSFIAIYIDLMFVNEYISTVRDAKDNRLQHTKDPNDPYIESTPVIT